MTRTLLRKLRRLDPVRGEEPRPDEALLAQILDLPAPATGSRRRAPRRLAVAVVAALGVSALLGAGNLGRSPTDVIARASEAVSGSGVILHYRYGHLGPDGAPDGFEEIWQDPETNESRELGHILASSGRPELHVEQTLSATETRTWMSNDETLTIGDRTHFHDGPAFGPAGTEKLGNLATLFHRARSGDVEAVDEGETTIRGIRVHKLRFGIAPPSCEEFERMDATDVVPSSFPVYVYVNAETYEPERLMLKSCHDPEGRHPTPTLDFSFFERLPRTPETQKLLEMSPHPGAKVVDHRK